jgi:hypothetical protein
MEQKQDDAILQSGERIPLLPKAFVQQKTWHIRTGIPLRRIKGRPSWLNW